MNKLRCKETVSYRRLRKIFYENLKTVDHLEKMSQISNDDNFEKLK